MAAALRKEGFFLNFDFVAQRGSYQRQLTLQQYDVILCDHNLQDWTGHDAFNLLRGIKKEIPFLVVTAALGDEAAVEYVKTGAADYVLKEHLERLPMAVWRALRDKQQRAANFELQEQRKRLEAQLLQAQKMEAVGRLAGGIAHDFNNILQVILGYAHVIQENPAAVAAHAQAEEIAAAARTAASLTRQLLTFSGKQIQQPELFNLNDVIGETTSMLGPLIGEVIEFETKLGAKAGGIRADRSQIQHALMNLAVNARDAMPSGGRLLIETSDVTAGQPEVYGIVSARIKNAF